MTLFKEATRSSIPSVKCSSTVSTIFSDPFRVTKTVLIMGKMAAITTIARIFDRTKNPTFSSLISYGCGIGHHGVLLTTKTSSESG